MKKTYWFYLQSIAKVANTTHPIKVEKSAETSSMDFYAQLVMVKP